MLIKYQWRLTYCIILPFDLLNVPHVGFSSSVHTLLQRGPALVPIIQINKTHKIITKIADKFILVVNKFNGYDEESGTD